MGREGETMTILTRRTFLIGSAAVPLIYGLKELTAGGQDADPAWIADALARMKQTGRWGLVLVLPADPMARFRFGQQLWALTAFPNEDLEAHALFCEVVVVVMTSELARKHFAVAAASTRVLLSHEGKVLESDSEPVLLDRPKEFAASYKSFVHGEGSKRLTGRAAEVEKALPPELQAALAKLGSESADEQAAAKLTLARHVEKVTLPLAVLAEAASAELTRKRAFNLLTGHYAALNVKEPGAKLPYGASGPHHYSPCPSCGLGCLPPRSQMFLRFLIPGEPVPKEDD
jgi:hypothetical protein